MHSFGSDPWPNAGESPTSAVAECSEGCEVRSTQFAALLSDKPVNDIFANGSGCDFVGQSSPASNSSGKAQMQNLLCHHLLVFYLPSRSRWMEVTRGEHWSLLIWSMFVRALEPEIQNHLFSCICSHLPAQQINNCFCHWLLLEIHTLISSVVWPSSLQIKQYVPFVTALKNK